MKISNYKANLIKSLIYPVTFVNIIINFILYTNMKLSLTILSALVLSAGASYNQVS